MSSPASSDLKKGLKIFIVLTLLVICAILLYFHFKKPAPSEIMLFGNIEIREVSLSFRVSGRLKNIYFEEGDYVKNRHSCSLRLCRICRLKSADFKRGGLRCALRLSLGPPCGRSKGSMLAPREVFLN